MENRRDARNECYSEIRGRIKSLADEYGREHPQFMGDKRSRLGMEWMARLFEDVFAILNRYEITRKGKP